MKKSWDKVGCLGWLMTRFYDRSIDTTVWTKNDSMTVNEKSVLTSGHSISPTVSNSVKGFHMFL